MLNTYINIYCTYIYIYTRKCIGIDKKCPGFPIIYVILDLQFLGQDSTQVGSRARQKRGRDDDGDGVYLVPPVGTSRAKLGTDGGYNTYTREGGSWGGGGAATLGLFVHNLSTKNTKKYTTTVYYTKLT